MTLRLAIVVALGAGFVLARIAYRRWRARVHADDGPVPRVPDRLLVDGGTTWIVFTTPFCATCTPVCRLIGEADPGTPLTTVDATEQPELAGAFRIRRVPTVLLAAGDGTVQTRLVGPEAVSEYLLPAPAPAPASSGSTR